MNRRDFVKGAGCLAGFFGFASLSKTAKAEPKPVDEIERMALEVIKYHNAKKMRFDDAKDLHKALSVPFATLPLNMYVRDPGVGSKIVEPQLYGLVSQLKKNATRVEAARTVEKVSARLWEMIRPQGPDIKQVNNLTKYWMLGDTRVMADRLITPRFVIDVDELDCFKLAEMFTGVHDIQAELEQKLSICLGEARVRNIPGRVHLRYEPLTTYVKSEAYLLEIFHWTTAGGVVY